MAGPTSSVSVDAISKALSFLLEDFRRRNQDSQNVEEMLDYMPAAYNQLGKRAYELESVLSAFQHHIQQAITDIRRQQNTLTPIHRLPAELLGYTYLLLADEVYGPYADLSVIHAESDYNTAEDVDQPDLRPDRVYSMAIKIGSVCSYWRQITISTAQLWAYIGTRNSLHLNSILLKRSMEAALHVSCSVDMDKEHEQEHEQEFLRMAIPHLHRWKSFDSFTRSAALLEGFNLEGLAASVLEHFTIHMSANDPQFSGLEKLPAVVLERAPRLHNLHILNLGYPLGSNVVSGLTNLSVMTTVGDRCFTMEDFELLFSTSPRLETLCLHGQEGSDVNIQLTLFSVKLFNLKLLQTRFLDPKIITSLLLSLFPEHGLYPETKVYGDWLLEREMSTILPSARAGSLLHLYLNKMTWLEAEQYSGKQAEAALIHVGIDLPGEDPLTLLQIDTHDETGSTEEIVAGFLGSGGPSLLRSIELAITPEFGGTLLGSKLHLCPHLEQLTFDFRYHYDLESFSRSMVALSLPHLNDVIEPFPLPGPRPKALHFKWCKLRPLIELFQTKYGPSQDVPITAGLLNGLETIFVLYNGIFSDEDTEQDLALTLESQNIQVDITRYAGFMI